MAGERRQVRLPPLKIRTRIILPFLLLTVILGVAGTFLSTSLVAGPLENSLEKKLIAAEGIAGDTVAQVEERQLANLRLIANTEGVDQAVVRGDAASLKNLIVPLVVNDPVGNVKIFNTQGRTILEIDQADPSKPGDLTFSSGTDLSSEAIVTPLLRGESDALGDKYAGFLGNPPTQLAVAGPIRSLDRFVGGVVVATALDSVLHDMGKPFNADVAILGQDGQVIGSTLPQLQAGLLDPATRSDLGVSPGKALLRNLAVNGEPYELVFARFDLRQRRAGYLVTAFPRTGLLADTRRSAIQMTLLFTAGVLVLLLIGYTLALRLTRPIEDLVSGAHAIARGDLTHRIRVQSRDELGRLGEAFNSMTADLQDRTDALNQQVRRLEESYVATIAALAAALDAKDSYTEAHSRETAALALAVGRRLGLEGQALRFVEYGALLHDIGKIGIPGYVLNKPGPLGAEEFGIMRQHPVIGERIISSVPFLAPVRPVVRAEHERWDGKGYPDGLTADRIPIEARIIHACDAFHAMATDRPYRKALPRDQILAELRAQSGKQFDPAVVDALLKVLETEEVKVTGHNHPLGASGQATAPAGPLRWGQHLEAIEAVGTQLGRQVTVHQVCRLIGEAIVAIVPYDECRIYQLSRDGKGLVPAYFSDTKRAEYAGITETDLIVRIGEGITGWVAETKQGVLIEDMEQHPKALHIPGTSRHDESMMAVPVIFEQQLVGVIATVKVGLHQYSTDHLRLLTILANQAALSIANARLLEQLAAGAHTDPLTGLTNQRAVEAEIERRTASASGVFSILMLNVDPQRPVGDSRDHPTAAVLERVVEVLRTSLRPEDRLARWDAGAFLILIPDLDAAGAGSLARRIQRTLSTLSRFAGPIAVSIGTASFPSDAITADELLAAAARTMSAREGRTAA